MPPSLDPSLVPESLAPELDPPLPLLPSTLLSAPELLAPAPLLLALPPSGPASSLLGPLSSPPLPSSPESALPSPLLLELAAPLQVPPELPTVPSIDPSRLPDGELEVEGLPQRHTANAMAINPIRRT